MEIPSSLYVIFFFFIAATFPLDAVEEVSPVWRASHPNVSSVLNHDDDGDGASNQTEAWAGTNPVDSTDRFGVSSVHVIAGRLALRWRAMKGRSYAVEHRSDSGSEWVAVASDEASHGGPREVVLPANGPTQGEYRVVLQARDPVEQAALDAMQDHDTDGDGQADVLEYLAGTHPFDPESTLENGVVFSGPFVTLEWPAQAGKAYQVQYSESLNREGWSNAGEIRESAGGTMRAVLALSEIQGRFFRIVASDLPSGIEGLTEWEVNRLGLDPLERAGFQRGNFDVGQWLDQPEVIHIESPEPVANITQGGVGLIEIRREQAVREHKLQYTVSGTAIPGVDYEALPGEVILPFGVRSVQLPIIPLQSGQDFGSKSVTLNIALPPDEEGLPQTQEVTVNLIHESRISVRDFGAVGDGVTDDTVAIQSAIQALEASPSHNTLWFPSGSYRVSQLTSQPFTSGSHYRTLFLGTSDLSGRDLNFAGDSGAELLSTTGTLRSHILLTRARWRSLSFHNLTFRKDSQPLRLVQPGGEPNGAYGVAVVDWYGQSLEKLGFEDCSFVNCHGAVRTFGNGSNLWGKLKQFNMTDCQVLNPYGSNTVEGTSAYGGGQQVNLTPWVGNAVYRRNLFIGGPDDISTTYNPGGVPKDGSHFGSPLRLDFTENIVRNMGVEAVFPTSDPRVGHLTSALLIPPANSGQTVEASVKPEDSVFAIGTSINIRAWVNNANRNCVLLIRNIDPTGTILTLENIGQSLEIVDGLTMPAHAPLYIQNKQPCVASVTNNIITSDNGRSGIGVASNSRAFIANNFIKNYGVGINFYPEVRDILGKPERGSSAANNIIAWNLPVDSDSFSYGIQSWGSEINVVNNFLQTNLATKCFGIVTRGDADLIRENFVSTKLLLNHGYSSGIRSVGIGIGNTATKALSSRNHSSGFDVGIGPAQPYQTIPYLMNEHFSFNDVLPIDPRGVTTP